MANKKMNIRSPSTVPFSWEEKPGISKFSSNTSAQNVIIRPLQKSSSSYTDIPSTISTYSLKISPPPCGGQPPTRSNFLTKGLWWSRDDPFVAAMKQCTKNIKHLGLPASEEKICIGSNGKNNKKIVFSCKKFSTFDVREDNLVRLPSNKLPPLPRERKKKLTWQW